MNTSLKKLCVWWYVVVNDSSSLKVNNIFALKLNYIQDKLIWTVVVNRQVNALILTSLKQMN